MIKARDLKRGDYFTTQVHCEVIEVSSVAGGARIKVVAAVENPRSGSLEYLDEGSMLALICKPDASSAFSGAAAMMVVTMMSSLTRRIQANW
jgi:hypothetical protein